MFENDDDDDDETWPGAVPRLLSDDDAHSFVWYVLDVVKRHGWMEQDKSIPDWLEERLR